MPTLFTNILIPIDVSENTDLAIQKAIELSQPENAVIHLFHVANTFQFNGCYMQGHFSSAAVINDWHKEDIENKLMPYKQAIKKTLPCAEVNIHIATCDGIEKSIIEIANKLKVQLIIIGKRKTGK